MSIRKESMSTKEKEQSLKNEWVKISPIKRIQEKYPFAIELVENGYLQLLEIRGKDLYSLGREEMNQTLIHYFHWITDFSYDWTIYATTLPTDTTPQITYLKKCLSQCRMQMKECKSQRKYAQLQDQERILRINIQTEEQIKKEIYNVEFILFLFAPTVKELNELVKKAQAYGNGDFVPMEIKWEKKLQILKQFFNMHDKI